MLEPITVIIPTFRRPTLLRQTIEHLQLNFHYSGQVLIHVSTDDKTDGSKEAIAGLQNVTHFNGPARGMGANLNFLLSTVKTDVMFQMDDDTFLVKPMCVDVHVEKLRTDKKAGVIRLAMLGGHKYTAKLDADQNINHAYWWIDWGCAEHYIASNRPHLKHKRWHDQMGVFPEGVPIGRTEEGFCHICNNMAIQMGDKALGVLIPMDVMTESSWEHHGVESWNQKGL